MNRCAATRRSSTRFRSRTYLWSTRPWLVVSGTSRVSQAAQVEPIAGFGVRSVLNLMLTYEPHTGLVVGDGVIPVTFVLRIRFGVSDSPGMLAVIWQGEMPMPGLRSTGGV